MIHSIVSNRTSLLTTVVATVVAVIAVLFVSAGCRRENALDPAARPSPTPPPPLVVAAAADLQFAFDEIARLFEQHTGQPVTLVFGSSGQLAQQIENGAPFDLFASANLAFVERLQEKGLVLPESVVMYAEGHLALAVNRNVAVRLTGLHDLENPLIQRIAIANPEHAPYGLAAKEALIAAGLWERIEPKLIYGENVRQTLQFIQTGDAQAGIISQSIADVPEIVWIPVEPSLYSPLEQTLAIIASSSQPEAARAFAAFVTGKEGRAILKQRGFGLPNE